MCIVLKALPLVYRKRLHVSLSYFIVIVKIKVKNKNFGFELKYFPVFFQN